MVDKDQIEAILRDNFSISGNYKIEPRTGVVDVSGDVHLTTTVSQLPVQFGTVSGFFRCQENQLTTLAGAPHHVKGHFICGYNQLTNLEGGPKYVGGSMLCWSNKLTTLKGAPEEVGEDFLCNINSLTDLIHAPRIVGGTFSCSGNQVTTLEGGPQSVGSYICNGNKLTTLLGVPAIISGRFDCTRNPLKNLNGSPQSVAKEWRLTYTNKLPLLRTLVSGQVDFDTNAAKASQVNDILNDHAGEGKAGAIKAAAKLIKAGYKDNARW